MKNEIASVSGGRESTPPLRASKRRGLVPLAVAMGRSSRSKQGKYVRTQRRAALAEKEEEKNQKKYDVMAKVLAAPSPAQERRRDRMDEEEPSAAPVQVEKTMEEDTEMGNNNGRKGRRGKKDDKSGKWYTMFPVVLNKKKRQKYAKKGLRG